MVKFAADISAAEDNLQAAPININTLGVNTIVTGVPGEVIRIYRLVLVATVANTITFLDGATPLSGPIFLATAQGLFFRFDTKPWFDTTAGNSFNISLSSANQVSGVLYYATNELPATFTPPNGYITEDGSKFYVAEDGATFYVQES